MNTAASGTDAVESRRRVVSELLDRRRTFQARELIGAALQEDPDDLDMLFQAARAELIDDRPRDARQRITEVLQRDPDHLGARLLLLTVLTNQGELPQAEEMALSLLHLYPQSAGLYCAYAQVMLRALHLEKAAALTAEALRLAPDDADALRLQALCDLVRGVRGLDGGALQRVLKQFPQDQDTLALLVTSLANAGRATEALRCARQLLRANPQSRHWLDVTKQLIAATHWSMAPLRPLQRHGWGVSIGLWVVCVLLLRAAAVYAPSMSGPLTWAILVYVAYSWIWPPLFRKWILRE